MTRINNIIHATSVLTGTIIGVGLFALPYITSKVGFLAMLGYFFVLGFLVILIHSIFGELSLMTPDMKRLPGFAGIYLGRWGRKVAFVSSIAGMLAAILAYAIVGGEFLSELLSPFFGGDSTVYTIFYLIIGSALIFLGIKIISKIELWALIIFLVISLAVFLLSKPFINTVNLFSDFDASQLFLPYGIILFSLWGAALIPEVEEMLGSDKRLIRIIIPASIIIAALVYLFFIYLVVGLTGGATTELALTGLKGVLGNNIVSLLLLIGVLTTFTSFITVGLTLEKVFWYDLKINKILSWAITCFLPLILFLAGIKNFIAVIGVTGAIMLGLDGILILLMYERATKKKSVLLLAIVFLVGLIYEAVHLIK